MIGYLSQNYPLIHAFSPRTAAVRTRQENLVRNRVFKMAPKLSDYFGEGEILAVKGSLDRPISGLVLDSRRVVPGNLFFALPGRRTDGTSFIDEAVNRGAVAIVLEKMPALPPGKVTVIQVADARAPGGVAYGKAVAAPSFKHIGEQLIQYLDIKPVYAPAGRDALVMGGTHR